MTRRVSQIGDAGMTERGGPMRSSFAVRAAAVAGNVAAAGAAATPAAWAGNANAGIKGAPHSNPIAGVTWGPYEGPSDSLWAAYASARGRRRTLLGRLALKPRALF